MRNLVRLTALLLAGLVADPAGPAPSGADWRTAEPDYAWSFPEDHWPHPGYRTEWWYLTGELESVEAPSKRFGYQFILFRVGLTPRPPQLDSTWSASNLLMGHAAVTDLTGGGHRFSEVLYRETPLLAGFGRWPDPDIAWSLGPAGTPERWTLRWNGAAFDVRMADARRGVAIDLSTRPLKPPVFQGPNGYSRKADEAGVASLYYSFTRLATSGELQVDGATWQVRGESWIDREISTSQLGRQQVGWDWFGLQLTDGRELMLYRLRRADGSTDFASGTLIGADGETSHLSAGEWTLSQTEHWKSPRTGAVYPAGWRVDVGGAGLSLTIEPLLADQENVADLAGGLHYWEGAVRMRDVDGKIVGRGYVELTGYGEDNRPPI